MKKTNIIIIGGGLLRKGETKYIDQYVANFINKKKPIVSFFPTASDDLSVYIKIFKREYKKYNFEINIIYQKDLKNIENLEEKILTSDLLYFGGGDPKILLKYLKNDKIIKILRKAYNQNIIFMGLSAGAVIWYKNFIIKTKYGYTITKGLDWLKNNIIVHYNNEEIKQKVYSKLPTKKIIAVQNNCAIHYQNNKIFKIIDRKDGKIFLITPKYKKTLTK
ncbi:MAG TPA: Type 1 glutamine amidotransferase-like domain-containing protein [bacterium]|nr:Type 1 glutamine amidotransferase-like domain-containing protein [bacterium]